MESYANEEIEALRRIRENLATTLSTREKLEAKYKAINRPKIKLYRRFCRNAPRDVDTSHLEALYAEADKQVHEAKMRAVAEDEEYLNTEIERVLLALKMKSENYGHVSRITKEIQNVPGFISMADKAKKIFEPEGQAMEDEEEVSCGQPENINVDTDRDPQTKRFQTEIIQLLQKQDEQISKSNRETILNQRI